MALPGTINLETVPKAEDKFPQTETDPVNELVVFHNENDPAQLVACSRHWRHVDYPLVRSLLRQWYWKSPQRHSKKWVFNGRDRGTEEKTLLPIIPAV